MLSPDNICDPLKECRLFNVFSVYDPFKHSYFRISFATKTWIFKYVLKIGFYRFFCVLALVMLTLLTEFFIITNKDVIKNRCHHLVFTNAYLSVIMNPFLDVEYAIHRRTA